MVYQTYYQIRAEDPAFLAVVIKPLRAEFHSPQFYENGDALESNNWYDHEADLKEVSRSLHQHLIMLEGREENGKRWTKWFYKGYMRMEKHPPLEYRPLPLYLNDSMRFPS